MLTLHQTLAPIGYRVEWAKKHLAQLEQGVEVFMATEPYKVEKKPDPEDTNALRYYVVSVPSGQPIDIPLIAGDVLFNLRAALDHLAYQLVLANGITDKNILRRTYFPIFDSAKACAKNLAAKTPGISDTARHAIANVRPYKGGNNLLWQLQRLNNRDKHRTLITVGSALGWHSLPININQGVIDTLKEAHAKNQLSDWEDVMGSHDPSEIEYVNVRPAFRRCPLEVGDELTLAWDNPAIHKDADLKFTFEIAFLEPDVIQTESVISTLKAMTRAVDSIIFDFKPLFG